MKTRSFSKDKKKAHVSHLHFIHFQIQILNLSQDLSHFTKTIHFSLFFEKDLHLSQFSIYFEVQKVFMLQ